MAILALIIIAILAIRGVSKPFMALLALLLVYVIQPGELYPGLAPLHMERVLIILIFASLFIHGEKLRFPVITKRFLWFYGGMIAAIPLAFWRMGAIGTCQWFLETVLFHLAIVSLLTSENKIKQFIVVLVTLVGWIGASSLYLYMTGHIQFAMGIDRAEGLTSSGGDPNTLAITLVTAVPLDFLLMARGNSKWLRLLGVAIFTISVLTIISTGSRTAFFTLLLVLFLMVMRKPKNLKFLPVLLLLLPLFWMAIPEQYKARYETVDKLKNDLSYQNRVRSWHGGMRMFAHNPLTGVGPGNYVYANGMKYWPGNPRHWLNAHSLYFQTLGELGLVGIGTFGAFLICFFRTNFRLSKELAERDASPVLRGFPGACNLVLILLLFTGYSAHNLYRDTWYELAAITGALSLLAPKGIQAPKQEEKKELPPWIPAREEEAMPEEPAQV